MQIYTNSPIIEGLTFDDVLLIPAHSDVLPPFRVKWMLPLN